MTVSGDQNKGWKPDTLSKMLIGLSVLVGLLSLGLWFLPDYLVSTNQLGAWAAHVLPAPLSSDHAALRAWCHLAALLGGSGAVVIVLAVSLYDWLHARAEQQREQCAAVEAAEAILTAAADQQQDE